MKGAAASIAGHPFPVRKLHRLTYGRVNLREAWGRERTRAVAGGE